MVTDPPVRSPLYMDDDRQLRNEADPDGARALRVSTFRGFAPAAYDSFVGTYPDSVTEVWTYSKASAVVRTITFVFQDATKKVLISGTVT